MVLWLYIKVIVKRNETQVRERETQVADMGTNRDVRNTSGESRPDRKEGHYTQQLIAKEKSL